ncbi:MAG: beta-lactamase family protein [Cyclobacteriaceae bacterium]|nr:beta-lactamase family protein [Cyclobacteriaceae bacterium]
MNTLKSILSSLIIIFAMAALLISCSEKPAVSTFQQETDAFIEKNMKELHIPAVSFAVMQNGEYISSGVYGLAEVELNVPANEHTLFNVGSVGKTFTATAIMVLEEDGKLSIKDPIGKHLEGIPASWDNITIEHLLNHTSGIKDYVADFPGYTLLPNIDRAVELTPEHYIEMCTINPLNFPTGTRFAYSNSNYALLGFIIRKHIDTSMDEFIRKRVFEPAGMMDTRYEAAKELRANRAKGYHKDSTGVINGDLISDFYSTIGDCGILTSGKELAKWGPALADGKVISKTQVEKMWTKHQLNNGKLSQEDYITYGLGWRIDDVLGSPEFGHNGSFRKGYLGFYRYYPEHDLSIAIMMNQWSEMGKSFLLFGSLAESFLPDDLKFTGRQTIEGELADQWKEQIKTFGTLLSENEDLSPIVEKVYADIIADEYADFSKKWGENIVAAERHFLGEWDVSQKKVIKHGQKVKKIGLFREFSPELSEDWDTYITVYLSESGKIIGVSDKYLKKD